MEGVAMRFPLLPIALAVTLAVSVYAQTAPTPDISGTWVLNLAKSKLGKRATIRSETVVITCSGSNVQIHTTFDGHDETHMYIADGKERPFAVFQGGQDIVKAYWKKSALVVEMIGRVKSPDPSFGSTMDAFDAKDRWTLSPDSRVLTRESEAFDGKTVSVYDKQ
jgi:hypothetical protein